MPWYRAVYSLLFDWKGIQRINCHVLHFEQMDPQPVSQFLLLCFSCRICFEYADAAESLWEIALGSSE